jgi:NADH-quinone oxidoreductase subunit M
MSDFMALPVLLLLPVFGAIVAPMLGAKAGGRPLTMATMLAILAIALSVFVAYDGSAASTSAFALNLPWMPSLGINLKFAVDGLNVYLLLLTALLFPVVLACAWDSAEAQSPLFWSLLLALQACLLGTFLTQNLLVFFVLWEAVLVPMVLLILVFGGAQRRKAAVSFFLYTMAGSVLFLAAVIVLGVESQAQTGHWSFDFDVLYGLHLSPARQLFVFWAIALACAVKSPLFPFHSWLPLAYGEASPSGTALMAGVLSKMGAFGFIKLALPLCPDVAPMMAPAMILLAVVSIVYGAVLALRQSNFKQLVAYASLSHMGYIVLGVFSFQHTAVQGALFQILSHGLSVAGLFLMLGLLEQRCGAAYLQLEALATRMPRFAVVMMLFVLASLALPLTSGFTAEFLILLGSFTQALAAWQAGAGAARLVLVLLAATGVVLGATYMLRFARALVFGDAGKGGAPLPDLKTREVLALAPLLLLIALIGVWPAPLMSKVEPAVAQLAGLGAATVRPGTGPAAPRTAAIGKDGHGN